MIVADVVRALEELRQLGIIHRDIKPENIIYDRKQRTTKIVDFGFATYAANRNHVYPNCGTPGYAAPELLDKRNTIITFSADIFSLGVTLYFLLFGKLPYQDNSKNMLLANKEGRFAFSRALINNPSACDLIRRMVCPLRERITLQ